MNSDPMAQQISVPKSNYLRVIILNQLYKFRFGFSTSHPLLVCIVFRVF